MDELPLLPAQVSGVHEFTCIPCPLGQCCPLAHPNYSQVVKGSLSVLWPTQIHIHWVICGVHTVLFPMVNW